MKSPAAITTIGLCPSWDITCIGAELTWDAHQRIERQSWRPAGKALNVARALNWMRAPSIAAGLWGQTDYAEMIDHVSGWQCITAKFTAVPGSTRRNVTLIDRKRRREMHLRCPSGLATAETLPKLRRHLAKLVTRSSVCVFAGSMPPTELLPDVLAIIKMCRDRGARIVVDTSGAPLKAVVDMGGIWLIKPNVEELAELLRENIADRAGSLVKAARQLTGNVQTLLISRAAKGALVVTADRAWQGQCTVKRRVQSTVGCGDYLLAGFLEAWTKNSRLDTALRTALKVAAAHAWHWVETTAWTNARPKISVTVNKL